MRDVVDPHIHLWDQRGTPRRTSILYRLFGWNHAVLRFVALRAFPRDIIEFFGASQDVMVDYLTDRYRADTGPGGVSRYVHVQAGWEAKGPLGPVGETRWLAALDDPPAAIVAHADLGLGADVDAVLRAHLEASDRVRSVRYMLTHHPDPAVADFEPRADRMADATWRRGFERLAHHGLAFDAWVYHHQLPALAALARAIPEVPIVLCHAGTPVGLGGAYGSTGTTAGERASIASQWRDGIAELAELEHVHVKLSGFGMPVLGWGWHRRDAGSRVGVAEAVETIGPWFDEVIERFGARRCMFASNFPVDRVSIDGSTLYGAFGELARSRPPGDTDALFRTTAERVYGLAEA